MARKPMSDAARKARAKKAAATKAQKQKEALEALGLSTTRKKIRKTRKPMTAEQKAAAAERLAKARAARQAKNPEGSNRPEEFKRYVSDHPLSYEKTKENLKYQKELLSSYRSLKDSKDASERDLYNKTETYVQQLQNYLTTGEYTSLFYGKEGANRIKLTCVGMAYYPDGTPKRSQGVYYNDIDRVWTIEDDQAPKKKVRKGKKNG